MTSKIVHDDNLAWLQRWDKALLDPSCEARAVDGAVKDTRGLWIGYAQGAFRHIWRGKVALQFSFRAIPYFRLTKIGNGSKGSDKDHRAPQ